MRPEQQNSFSDDNNAYLDLTLILNTAVISYNVLCLDEDTSPSLTSSRCQPCQIAAPKPVRQMMLVPPDKQRSFQLKVWKKTSLTYRHANALPASVSSTQRHRTYLTPDTEYLISFCDEPSFGAD